MSRADRACVIGVGNALRGDDAAGLAFARRLRDRLPDGIPVLECDGDVTRLLDALNGTRAAFLVDAVRSGAAPGSVHQLDASAGPLPSALFHYSTHALNIADAIELARALGTLPPRAVVYGIEGARFDAGAPLSSAVERAVDKVVDGVAREVAMLVGVQA